MAKAMRNNSALLLLLCNIAFFIAQFHFGDTSTNPSSYSNNTNQTCIESERRALLEFKGSLVDTANRLASWTAGEDCCNWAGITCNPRTGHVHKLHLRNPIQRYWDQYTETDNSDSYWNNSLGGQINPSILNLEHLTYLDLSCNYFSGIQIPTFLGSLKNLRYLNLSYAGFRGEIPSHLGNLSNLQYLDLGSYELHANSLNWIIRLTSLKALDLSGTNLTECVDCFYSIGMIPSLSSLSLRRCFGSPVALSLDSPVALSLDLSPILNLTSLVSLDLGENYLRNSSILLPLLNLSSQLVVLKLDGNSLLGPSPIQLEKLTALAVLDLSFNYFNSSSMPHSLCNHTNLVYLALRVNQLQRSLPHCFGNLTFLRVLDLARNNFGEKIPIELGYLKQLTCLDLSQNQLSGVIPSTLGQLTKLQELDISYNSLTGELSESHFEKLKTLKYLSISNNYFLSLNVSSKWTPPFQLQIIEMDSVLLGSQFPPWLQTQRYVVELSMTNVSISGVIPTWFTSWSSIHGLYLSNNKIEGSSISFQPNIRRLDLSNNLLTGALSLHTNYLTNIPLEYFILNDNHLSGDILDTFCNLRSLRTLSLANNKLTGKIPLCFGKLSFLQTLSLANNKLTGKIPLCFGKLSFLSSLSLANNQLTGKIPSRFGNLSSLFILSLANNQLTGRIPSRFGNLSSLFILSLANNQLTGRIPLCFGNLTELQVLDLSNNSFSGHLPSTLGNLTSLYFLHLSRNKLSGVLPSSLKSLTSLITLDIGENQLTGTIPEWIGAKFLGLQFLRLESNKFYGNISMSLCQLSFLKILNLAQNNLDGPLPHCFGNLTRMRSKDAYESYVEVSGYSETLWNVMKGVGLAYTIRNLAYAKFISLSANNLHGEIPSELLDLEGLQSLNLSNNKLSGRIPENIGKLKNLESLDLAVNQLSGTIPQSLANIDTLSFLNLSFNNLVGRIPSGTHFDTLGVDQPIYEGNRGICGKPLAKSCPGDRTSKGKGPAIHENIDEGFELLWFYAGIAPGFAVGSVGVFCILYFKKSWRHAYFEFVERISGRVWVAFAVNISQFLTKFNYGFAND